MNMYYTNTFSQKQFVLVPVNTPTFGLRTGTFQRSMHSVEEKKDLRQTASTLHAQCRCLVGGSGDESEVALKMGFCIFMDIFKKYLWL